MQVLTPGAIADRLEAVLRHGKELEQRIHLRYAMQRLQAHDAAARAGTEAGDASWIDVQDVVKRLDAKLVDPAAERDVATRQAIVAGASRLRTLSARIRNDIGGRVQQRVAAMYRERF
jgi:hypothetical protein